MLLQIRECLNFTSRSTALAMGLDPSGFRRIELADNQATIETARAIQNVYTQLVPLGLIFDPTNPQYRNWLTDARKARLRRLSKELKAQHPKLRLIDG